MRTNCDITIYNKSVVAGVESYQRTQIKAVEWENRKAANVLASGGNIAADQATIYIPFARNADYAGPKTWQALISKTGKWTLQVGDYVVKGLVTDEIHAAIVSPPSPAFTMTNLRAKYDDVLQVSSVDVMDMGSLSMQHWKLGCK